MFKSHFMPLTSAIVFHRHLLLCSMDINFCQRKSNCSAINKGGWNFSVAEHQSLSGIRNFDYSFELPLQLNLPFDFSCVTVSVKLIAGTLALGSRGQRFKSDWARHIYIFGFVSRSFEFCLPSNSFQIMQSV